MNDYLKKKYKGYTFEELRMLIENEDVIKADDGQWYPCEDVKYCEHCQCYHNRDEFNFYDGVSCDDIIFENAKQGEV